MKKRIQVHIEELKKKKNTKTKKLLNNIGAGFKIYEQKFDFLFLFFTLFRK